MEQKEKIVKGMVNGTGFPIDGHILSFSLQDYDKENYHLIGWSEEADDAVMQTMYQTEQEIGLCLYSSIEQFAAAWKSGKWEADGVFCIPIENVEVKEA